MQPHLTTVHYGEDDRHDVVAQQRRYYAGSGLERDPERRPGWHMEVLVDEATRNRLSDQVYALGLPDHPRIMSLLSIDVYAEEENVTPDEIGAAYMEAVAEFRAAVRAADRTFLGMLATIREEHDSILHERREQDAERPPRVDAPQPVEKRVDERPHSRACGPFCRGHGPECSTNCPTCGGKAID